MGDRFSDRETHRAHEECTFVREVLLKCSDVQRRMDILHGASPRNSQVSKETTQDESGSASDDDGHVLEDDSSTAGVASAPSPLSEKQKKKVDFPDLHSKKNGDTDRS